MGSWAKRWAVGRNVFPGCQDRTYSHYSVLCAVWPTETVLQRTRSKHSTMINWPPIGRCAINGDASELRQSSADFSSWQVECSIECPCQLCTWFRKVRLISASESLTCVKYKYNRLYCVKKKIYYYVVQFRNSMKSIILTNQFQVQIWTYLHLKFHTS